MADDRNRQRVFVSAAEPSADSHCAGLLRALVKMGREIDFVGVGGPKMRAAGCELLESPTARASMGYDSFSHVAHYYKLIRRIRRYLSADNVDLVVVCDSPAFNFHVAKAAKRAGIKTVFYVAPQLWAWAGWRIKKLQRYCDKLCCILPFEEKWFGERGVDTVFVGHPVLDDLPGDLGVYKKDYVDFKAKEVLIALMPGSRAAEINSLWRPMQQIALRIKAKYAGANFVTVAVDYERKKILEATQIRGFGCEYTVGSVSDTAGRADFAIVASGSATLEVAAAGCPMVVVYQTSRLIWYLAGRWLVKAKYLALVNVLADRQVVPEFMPYFTSVDPIVQKCEDLLGDTDKLARMSAELIQLAQSVRTETASQKVAQVVREMLEGRNL